jgi:pullulanase
MLRSKSMDRNSYNSGDWFNRLDFTYQTNNFGVGLPPAGDNSAQWDLMRPLLADESLQASEADILANVNSFRDMLRVRYSTPLFRLQTADEIMQRLTFHNTGAEQVPALSSCTSPIPLVMTLTLPMMPLSWSSMPHPTNLPSQ